MIIGIDASRAFKRIRTGTEIYSYEIIKALLTLDRTDKFWLYSDSQPNDPEFKQFKNITWKVIERKKFWSQIGLANSLRNEKPDVLFIPSHVIPLMSNVPTVVTIHDLAYKYFPESYSFIQRRYLNFSTGVSVAKAKAIIVPSQSTKHDLVRYYKSVQKKIFVIPHGCSEDVVASISHKDTPPIASRYVLYIGRLEEKKNIRLLIDAFVLLTKEKKDIILVLAGSGGYGYDRIVQKLDELPSNIRNLINCPGYLPQYDMIRYLKHAAVFAFPSWYEGFGLPVIDAMTLGIPTICSNTSSLPEVAGDAAIQLPPNSPLSWASAMSRLINQPALAQKYRQAGINQAAQFTWEIAAQATLKVLHDAINR